MRDYRSKLIDLAEKCLHRFTEELIEHENLTNWREEICKAVQKEYPKHPVSYATMHSMIATKGEDKFSINQLDVPAIKTLLVYPLSKYLKDDIPGLWQETRNLISNIAFNRNTVEHSIKDGSKLPVRELFYDQLNTILAIEAFSTIVLRYYWENDFWKNILLQTRSLERGIFYDHYIQPGKNEDNVIDEASDISDIALIAENGNIKARTVLGKIYYNGERVEKDVDKALVWFIKAAREGEPEALYYMGVYYERGLSGIKPDMDTAADYYRKSADAGFAAAMSGLAGMYLLLQNPEYYGDVFIWAEKAAKQHDPDGVYYLHMCYAGGLGVEKNKEKAEELLEEAAELGHELAAELLMNASISEKALQEALYWAEKGNERGKLDSRIKWIKRKLEKE